MGIVNLETLQKLIDTVISRGKDLLDHYTQKYPKYTFTSIHFGKVFCAACIQAWTLPRIFPKKLKEI